MSFGGKPAFARGCILTLYEYGEKTYSEAEHVLAFSRELLQIPRPDTPYEAFVRIFLSKWMARLWTLQEAALAKCLAFQFSDSCLTDTLFDRMVAVLTNNMGDGALWGGLEAFLVVKQTQDDFQKRRGYFD